MEASELKKTLDTPTMHSLVQSYLLQRTYAEIIREKVNKVYREVLAEIPIYNDLDRRLAHEAKRRITENNDTYLSEDEESMQRIYTEVDRQLRESRVKPDEMSFDFCPALVAEDDLRKIERAIVDESGKPFNMTAAKILSSANALDNYRKWLDLVIGAIVNLPNFKKPNLKQRT